MPGRPEGLHGCPVGRPIEHVRQEPQFLGAGHLVEVVGNSDRLPGVRVGELEAVGIDRIEFAQFSQPPGFRSSLPAVGSPDGPVYLAGDYTQWSSIQGALESGKRAAAAVRSEEE